MTLPSGTRARRAARGRGAAVLLAIGALTLAGCDSDGEGADDAGTTQSDGGTTADAADETAGEGDDGSAEGDAADDEGEGEDEGEPAPPPTEPADIAVEAGDRSATQSGNTITITGGPVAFSSPTGTVSCVMTASSATCQVRDKTYTAPADQLVASSLGSCSAEDADAMILTDERGAWTCSPQPLARIGTLAQGGWWAEEVGTDTMNVGGLDVAVLPYGQSIELGSVSCSGTEEGMTCTNSELGQQIFISRSGYRYG